MKKILWLLSITFAIIALLVLVDTYGLFETNASSNSELSIGKWVIKLNDRDISLIQTINLNDFVYSSTTHTEEGYFAPGMSAEFDIVIDTTLTDVSVMYDLSIDDSAIDDYPNINFSITDMDTNTVIDSTNYSGIIYVNDINRVKTLKISLIWDDVLEYDESDSSLIGEMLEFLINANFKQYTGE